jgi:hypothetical protein
MTDSENRACPYCQTRIDRAAVKCASCGEWVNAAYRAIVMRPDFNPTTARVLSFFLPGVGQMYRGKWVQGVAWMLAVAIGYLVLLPGIVLHIFCVINAGKD